MSIEENKKLIERYPFLLPRDGWNDTVREDYDYSYTELDEMPKGWRKAFGNMMMEELREVLVEENFLDGFRILEIKEKWGELRLYTNYHNDKIERIIKKYTTLSRNICIHCGKPDTHMTYGGWYSPVCEECHEKRQQELEEKFGYEKTPYSEIVCKNDKGIMSDRFVWVNNFKGKDVETTYVFPETVEEIRRKWNEEHPEK